MQLKLNRTKKSNMSNTMKKSLFTIIGMLGLCAFARGEKIVIKGSDTIGAKLAPQLAEEFKASHPGVTFEIAAEGSSTGIAAILDGTADIGMASREAKDKEISKAKLSGVNIMPTVIAYDGIAVIVNEKNPITALKKSDVENIFTGDVSDWSALGGQPGKISAYTRNTASGTYKVFQDLAMSKRDYGPRTQKMAGNEQIAAEVAKNPNGVGYVGLAYIRTPGVKVASVDRQKPSNETINNKSYSLARPLYYYTNGFPTKPVVAEFINFTLSGKGQKIVSDVKFVPLK